MTMPRDEHGDDWREPTAADKAALGEKALRWYGSLVGDTMPDAIGDDDDLQEGHTVVTLADLLADLMHLTDESGAFEQALESARRTYADEVADQAEHGNVNP